MVKNAKEMGTANIQHKMPDTGSFQLKLFKAIVKMLLYNYAMFKFLVVRTSSFGNIHLTGSNLKIWHRA